MPDNPLEVSKTYTNEDSSWQNAFAEPDDRPAHLLRQDALSELDKPQSPAYWSMKQNFKQIDRNSDGLLDPNEISLAAQDDPDLKGLDADRQGQWNMKKLVHDGPKDARGISMRDVQAWGMQELSLSHTKELKHAADFLSSYFDKISRSKEGLITKDDLNQLISDPSLKFHFRQKFLLAERHFERISEQHKDKILKFKEHEGLSQKDLQVLIRNKGYFIK